MTGVKGFMDDTLKFLSDIWHYTVKYTTRGVKAVMDADYEALVNRVIANAKLFSNSKSIYLVALFLPLILTLIIAISLNTSHSLSNTVAYTLNDNQQKLTLSFISNLEKQDLELYEYGSNLSCKGAVETGKTTLCLIFPTDFFTEDNKSEKLIVNVDSSKVDVFSSYLGKINSSLVTTANKGEFTESVVIKSTSIKSKSFNSLFLGILMFFFMFLAILFTSTVAFHKKFFISDLYKTPEKYKSFMYDVFFSSFALVLVFSLALLLLSSLIFSFGFFAIFFKILLILILALPIFVFAGMLIGMLATTEELNLFVSVALTTVLIFFSDMIMPRAGTEGSLFFYILKFNPFHILTSLMRDIIIVGEGFELAMIFNLIIFALLFLVLFVFINFGLVTKGGYVKSIIREKEDDSDYIHIDSLEKSKSPALATEEMSMDEFERIKILQQEKRRQQQEFRPVYGKVVKVKLEKHKHHDKKDHEDSAKADETFHDELEEHLKGVLGEDDSPKHKLTAKEKFMLKKKEEKKGEENKKHHHNKNEDDDSDDEEKEDKHEERKETDSLIMKIELENEVLELKGKGLDDDAIVAKLSKKYDEEDIYEVLGNQ